MPQTATVRVYQLRFGCRRPCRRRRGMGRGLPRRRPMQQSPSCSKTGWPRPLIATWNGWPHAARPTAATALTRAGCSPSSACSSCTCHDPPNYDDARLVNFAAVPGQNAMYVSGAAPHVQKKVSVLRRADRRTAHILLETLVVEFATGALDRFNASIQNAVTGQFSDIDVVPGDPLFPSITFSFRGHLQPHAADCSDRPVRRPGQGADHLPALCRDPQRRGGDDQDATDRFVLVEDVEDGAAIVTPQEVSAGVTVTLRPTALANQAIRVEVDIEDSIFTPTAGDVALEKDTSEARTIMNVLSGQTIVIGGLTRKVSASSNAGLPWLRRVPLLNLALATRESEQTRRDVVVYITPYLWRPGMTTPLLRPESFGVQGDGGLFTPSESLPRSEYDD